MKHDPQHTPPQYEGQEHQFLNYENVYLHFIYSFSWDIDAITWEELRADLRGNSKPGEKSAKGWKTAKLHERNFRSSQGGSSPSYQPNFVVKGEVLERTSKIGDKIVLLIPLREYNGTALKKCAQLGAALDYTVRLFDNGSGTCTFVARLSGSNANFVNIHYLLRLAHNVDRGDEPVGHHRNLTNTFLQIPRRGKRYRGDSSLFPESAKESYSFARGYCSLHDLFRRLVSSNKLDWMPKSAPVIWADREVLSTGNIHQDFQSPFVFTVAQLERNAFLRFRKEPTLDVAREVGSILCKLTMDNRFIATHFLNLSEDYITNVLPFNKDREGLVNLCLDRRLFFMMSRRGAIALTASLDDLPSCFVIPSFLNLCEILRARWHISNLVSARLDRVITQMGSNPTFEPGKLMEELFKWRLMFAAFLRDPVPFLFDGGSITELAEIAESQLWLHRLREEIARKFQIVDSLVREYLNIRLEREMRATAGRKGAAIRPASGDRRLRR